MRIFGLSILVAGLFAAVGCNSNADFMTTNRLESGLVIILPGIEGHSTLNRDVRRGLVAAGIYRAMPIHAWGRPIPIAGPLLNQMDIIGNRLAGARVARIIVRYQDNYPGRPVHLVGHSGGGGIAVFAAEALPDDRKVDGLVLLSASISSAYNLTKALNRCRNGIVNFYSNADVGLLVIGTIVIGNVDGTHGPASGAIGFDWPREKDKDPKRLAYRRLYQVPMTSLMTGGGEVHAASTQVGFISTYVAPWVTRPIWPAGGAETYAGMSDPNHHIAKALASLGW